MTRQHDSRARHRTVHRVVTRYVSLLDVASGATWCNQLLSTPTELTLASLPQLPTRATLRVSTDLVPAPRRLALLAVIKGSGQVCGCPVVLTRPVGRLSHVATVCSVSGNPAEQAAYEQLALVIEEDARAKAWRKPRSGPSPIYWMVKFGLEQGYAHSIGDLLDQVAGIREHRLFNSLLIVLQRPHAKYLLPARQWRDRWGRRVRPGQHPILIMWPFSPDEFLFDVSQVEPASDRAPELPTERSNPFAMQHAQDAAFALHWMKNNATHDGVRTTTAGHGLSSAGQIARATPGRMLALEARDGSVAIGSSTRLRYEVLLNDAYSDTEQLATMAHELGHLYCGHLGALETDWWPARRPESEAMREFEAESVAQLVFRRVAPEAQLPPHLFQYFGENLPEPTDEWQHVANAADRIIDMCQGVSPRRSL